MTYEVYHAKRGDKGPQIKAIQRRLNEVMGTSLAVDGNYGVMTQTVVRDFQVANQLATTTYIDPPTALLLGLDFSATGPQLSTSNNLAIAGAFIAAVWLTKRYLLN